MPYLGFFDKIFKSDIFVILDDAQFSKGDFHNRNRIKTRNGTAWLTIPVHSGFIPINEVKINEQYKFSNSKWNDYHLTQIKDNYNTSPHFEEIFPLLYNILSLTYSKLIVINLKIIMLFLNLFKIKTKIVYSSALKLTTRSTERLIDIVKHFNADTYLSGSGAKKYLDSSLFADNNIKLEFHEYKHPVYKQNFDSFVPNLSALDYCFNEGSNLFVK